MAASSDVIPTMSAQGDDPWRGMNVLDPLIREQLRDDPYPFLRRLREIDPVNETPIGIWRLTRYDDVVRLLHAVRCGVRTTDGALPGIDESDPSTQRHFMLQQDPPAHTRLRRLVSRAFTPRAIERIRRSIETIVTECLDRVAARGEMDIIADLALPVPSTVICEMLGVPVADRERFTVWTAQATHGLAAPIAPPDVLERARDAALSLAAYFEDLIAKRRSSPSDDILSGMIRAEEGGDLLSHVELISQAIGLLIAGFETTIGLIGNGVRALLRHPAELAKLRARPELIGNAVDECLRFDGPILLTVRILHEDAEFGDKVIPRNAMVWGMLGAANRDPAKFLAPDSFDIERPNAAEHLAFGGGAHFCLGAHLAQLEGQIAIGALVRRFERLELRSEAVDWGASLFRVPGRLPVTFRAS
jgi:cytochrome P450